MFHSLLFTTADNILMLSAWVDVQYREEKLLVTPLYQTNNITIYKCFCNAAIHYHSEVITYAITHDE